MGRKEVGRGENVYHMTRHLLAAGSVLLEGDCFSISPRQSSNTVAIGGDRRGSESVEREQWVVGDCTYRRLHCSLR